MQLGEVRGDHGLWVDRRRRGRRQPSDGESAPRPSGPRRASFLVVSVDSYYPASLAADTAIEKPERIRGGAHALIEDDEGPIGRRIARSADDLAARMPTPREAELLRLPAGVPVVRVLRTIYDSEGQPVEVQDTIAAADRHRFRYEVNME